MKELIAYTIYKINIVMLICFGIICLLSMAILVALSIMHLIGFKDISTTTFIFLSNLMILSSIVISYIIEPIDKAFYTKKGLTK